MFVYRSRLMTRGEVWFDEEPDGAHVDWIHHWQRSSPLANGRSKDFYTRLVDLQKPATELFAQMDARTARKITDAQEKDKLRCEHCNPNDTKLIDRVESMWNQFAVAQKTPLLDRPWLDQMFQAGALHLTAAKDPEGAVLAYHLVLLTPKRARQVIAISPYRAVPSVAWRQIVSRANCFAHWENFLTYREQGIAWFDFGGWYPGTTDIRLLGMNSFKKGFGGKVVREYECEQAITLKGQALLTLARILQRIRQSRASTPKQPESKKNATEEQQDPKVSPAFR